MKELKRLKELHEQKKWLAKNLKKPDMERLPHWMSDDIGKTLKIEDWGNPEEVEKMATMKRGKKDLRGTRAILEKLRKLGTIQNKFQNLQANISRDSIGKLMKGDWLIAANPDQLFENAIETEKFELNPDKNNKGVKERRFLYSPMEDDSKIVPVKLTHFEYENPESTNQLYAGEKIDHDLKKSGTLVLSNAGVSLSVSRRPDTINIPHQSHYVNRTQCLTLKRTIKRLESHVKNEP